MELRIRIISIGFVVAVVVLVGKLAFWQVVRGQELASQGRYQQQSTRLIDAKRGDILSSDGSYLAASNDAWLLVAQRPKFVESPAKVASELAKLFKGEEIYEDDEEKDEALDREEKRLYDLLVRDELMWIPLKNRVDRAMREKIEKLAFEGLEFEIEEDRYYPEASAAAQILGFVGKDEDGNDKGYFGLEGYYDLSLAGKEGFRSREANALGVPIIFGDSKEASAIRGTDLITHIDRTIQIVVESKLAEGLEKYGALSGNIIVTNPQTGAILAMATSPSYDPKKYYDYGDEFFRNPVISDAFEPGSIFKPLVMAAALDAGVVKPDTICDICDKPYQVDKYFIRTWNNEYNAGATMQDVIVHSDNVGMAFTGNRLGADRLHDYLSAYGFGGLTGIDLQGEVTPSIRSKGTWNVVDLATTSFGQGIAVTPIQMVSALGALANKGVLMAPQLVDKIKIAGDTEDIEPVEVRRVVSRDAAEDITRMMIAAVKSGEAKWAVPAGFTIAGKTGTAQIPVAGHYDSEKTIASFVGFAPPSDPKFLMLITLREPQSSPWASETAAPLWFDIAKEIFPYLGIQPGE